MLSHIAFQAQACDMLPTAATQVVLDTEGRGRYSYKQLMMALKEAKTAGHWLEGSPDIQALLSALAVRLQEQGRDFRKVLLNERLLKEMLSPGVLSFHAQSATQSGRVVDMLTAAGHFYGRNCNCPALHSTALHCTALHSTEKDSNVQVFEAFDTEGEGSLGYEGVAALVRRQLPNLTAEELRGIMGHIHLLDKDGALLASQQLWPFVALPSHHASH